VTHVGSWWRPEAMSQRHVGGPRFDGPRSWWGIPSSVWPALSKGHRQAHQFRRISAGALIAAVRGSTWKAGALSRAIIFREDHVIAV